MKKGLRLSCLTYLPAAVPFKRGPDEEGIETSCLTYLPAAVPFKRGPDEEGIETTETPGTRLQCLVQTRT